MKTHHIGQSLDAFLKDEGIYDRVVDTDTKNIERVSFKSECIGCSGQGIDCEDSCIKPKRLS